MNEMNDHWTLRSESTMNEYGTINPMESLRDRLTEEHTMSYVSYLDNAINKALGGPDMDLNVEEELEVTPSP